MKRTTFITALLIAISIAAGCGGNRLPLASDPASPVSAALSTNSVQIGQLFSMTATVKASPDDRVDWPTPGIPPALVQRNSHELSDGVPAGYRARQWELIALRPGTFPVWTSAVTRISATGEKTLLPPPALEVQVVSSLSSGDEAIRDIAGLQQWPRAISTRLLTALGAVALLALAIALIARKLLHRKERATPQAPPLPPHEIALRALRALREQGWPDAEGIESFYVALSNIVRRFLEGAFHLRAPEQTTEEFIRTATTSRSLTMEHQQLVFAFLEQSDLVKFARHTPGQRDMAAALDAAERLVQETQPPPLTQPASPTSQAS